MRALLLNTPNPVGYQANRDFMGNYGMLNTQPGVVLPPLHLIQMASTIDSKFVHFIDAAALDLKEDETKTLISQPSYAFAVVMTSTPTFAQDCEMAKWIKQKKKCRVLLYGPHAAHVAKEAFERSDADGILVGYTPDTLGAILDQKQGLPKLSELITPDAIPKVPPVAPNFSLDELPFPAWELTPLKKYRFDMREPTPFASMRTSLGCVYSCAYCPYVLAEGNRFLHMSPERIYAEMKYLSEDLGVRFILFRDLLFTAQQSRIEKLCKLLIEKPLNVVWRAETSTQHLSENLLEQMAKAGCNGMNLGVESVDEASALEMDLVSKRKNLEKVKDVFRWCNKYGIKTNALFVIGFPEDSKQGIEKSVQFAQELNAETVHFAYAMPFPGTELEKIAKKENLIELSDWEDMTSQQPVMRTRFLSREEVNLLGKKALRSIYLDPQRISKMLLHPAAFVKRANAFLRYYLKH